MGIYRVLVLDSPRLGEFNNSRVYMARDLASKLSPDEVESIRQGKGVRGLKHLLERIRQADKAGCLIFTIDDNRRIGSNFYISLKDYRTAGQNDFTKLWRETGLRVSRRFLSEKLGVEIEPAPNEAADGRRRPRNDQALVDDTAKLLAELRQEGGDLDRKRRLLRRERRTLERMRHDSEVLARQEVLREFRERLVPGKEYHETRGTNSWQKWIYRNSWLMGAQYLEPLDRQRVGLHQIPDYVFPTIEGFVDILEIKLPKHPVLVSDSSHSGSYAWSSEVNRAIGQVVNYLQEMEDIQTKLTQTFNDQYFDGMGLRVRIVTPRALILIGRDDEWPALQKAAFRRLNYALHGIQVVTYSEVERQASRLIDTLTKST